MAGVYLWGGVLKANPGYKNDFLYVFKPILEPVYLWISPELDWMDWAHVTMPLFYISPILEGACALLLMLPSDRVRRFGIVFLVAMHSVVLCRLVYEFGIVFLVAMHSVVLCRLVYEVHEVGVWPWNVGVCAICFVLFWDYTSPATLLCDDTHESGSSSSSSSSDSNSNNNNSNSNNSNSNSNNNSSNSSASGLS
eukprot:TRINITY_DN3033_c0_g1_i1.p1 TRINITY_DN3033_c0_g1~~TRINITY_DN3033_c0_g1_i1.p1  ORF type:complete len:195 (+),score=57.38 TRINITY_DN3033_c0_g1_i1:471-1055(+)